VGARGARAQAVAIAALSGAASAIVRRQAANRAARSASVRSVAGFCAARIAAWSIGGAAGAGSFVRLTRQQPGIVLSTPRGGFVPAHVSVILSRVPAGTSSGS
jgi:hypothetical protein